MTQRFDLVLTGRVMPGQSLEAVAAGLAKLLRIDGARARAMLSGRETVVKRGQTREALEPFLDALTKIGAEPGLRATLPAAPPAAAAEPKRAASTVPGAPVAPPDDCPVALKADSCSISLRTSTGSSWYSAEYRLRMSKYGDGRWSRLGVQAKMA